ncbi:hypothetical protein HYY69_08265 [Candidatus Woesearchaeota archaeon]|nr:hypothetical protein [Candidatus Woesearchaeota archaeon]
MTWINRWAGSYTFLSCSYWAQQYSKTLSRILGKGFENGLFIHKQGTASFFVKENEFKAFGQYLAEKIANSEIEALTLLNKLKENTDLIMNIMDEFQGMILTSEQYAVFHKVFDQHLAYHNFMKKTVDFLDKEQLEKLLPYFQDARKYSEAVYSRTEQFFRSLTTAIAIKENYNAQALTCLMQEELENYIKCGILPSEGKLSMRFDASAILLEHGSIRLLTGSDALQLEQKLFSSNMTQIKGIVAFKGNVKGTCRIVYDPFKEHTFNKGDILVTGMTRPEFTPFMEKAGAIITDAGGLLCHAAITAREMKIPCIIGTEKATRVFKEGDIIEINENGVIRKFNT